MNAHRMHLTKATLNTYYITSTVDLSGVFVIMKLKLIYFICIHRHYVSKLKKRVVNIGMLKESIEYLIYMN